MSMDSRKRIVMCRVVGYLQCTVECACGQNSIFLNLKWHVSKELSVNQCFSVIKIGILQKNIPVISANKV